MSMLDCPDENRLCDLLLRPASDEEAQNIERHVVACARCRAVLERLTAVPDEWQADVREIAMSGGNNSSVEIDYRSIVDRLCETRRIEERVAANGRPLRYVRTHRIADYEVLGRIGSGGMGHVLRVRHRKSQQLYALKVLTDERFRRPESVARFQREIRLLRELRHQQVVHAVDSGLWRGVPFVVMEFLHGLDLDELVRQHGPLAVPEAAEIARQIAIGLRYVHELRLVHRDVKPSNVMLTGDRVCLLDLGLARVSESDWDQSGSTLTGEALGTLRYAAPEQLAQAHAVDQRADLFSLGATLLWLVTGKHPPFDWEARSDTLRDLDGMHAIDARFTRLVERMLAASPDQRPSSVEEVLPTLEHLAAGHRLDELMREAVPTVDLTDVSTAPLLVVEIAVLDECVTWRQKVLVGVLLMAVLIGTVLFGRSRETVKTASLPATSAGTDNPNPESNVVESKTPDMTQAPFSTEQALRSQAEWARYLGVPVEFKNSIGMKLRLIPPGEYLRGGSDADVALTLKFTEAANEHAVACVKSEFPARRVLVTRPFYFGKFEVTQAEFEKVVGHNPSLFAKSGINLDLVGRVTGFDTSQHAVDNVSRHDAAEFCTKLSQLEQLNPRYFVAGENCTLVTGNGYRLPTEAEWELACRAGTLTSYWSGSAEADFLRVGWGGANSGLRTHAVGELPGNPFGLHDMHGNVFEWCEDTWLPSTYSELTEGGVRDPIETRSNRRLHVLRGGSWSPGALFCRSSFRIAFDFGGRAQDFGFRVALSVEAVREMQTRGP